MTLFSFSKVNGPAVPDENGRYRRGGGLNVPVEVQLLVNKANLDNFLASLGGRHIHEVIP